MIGYCLVFHNIRFLFLIEALLRKQQEEESRKAEEEFMLSQMAEQEKLEYEMRKREEEERRWKLEDKLRLVSVLNAYRTDSIYMHVFYLIPLRSFLYAIMANG